MNTGDICEELNRRAELAGVDLTIDRVNNAWYAILVTRKVSYTNLVVRSFEAETLEGLMRRVRFPYRTQSGRAVYV